MTDPRLSAPFRAFPRLSTLKIIYGRSRPTLDFGLTVRSYPEPSGAIRSYPGNEIFLADRSLTVTNGNQR